MNFIDLDVLASEDLNHLRCSARPREVGERREREKRISYAAELLDRLRLGWHRRHQAEVQAL